MNKNLLNNIWKNKNFLSVFLAFIIFIVIFIWNLLVLYIFDKNLQSFYLYIKKELLNDTVEVSNNIVVVEIDDNTLDSPLWRFPFNREVYSNLIKNLNDAWATVIGFDIIFADKSDLISDSVFAKAIKEAWNIVLWWSTLDEWWVEWVIEKPLTAFMKWAVSLWYFTPNIDPKTNIVYSSSAFKTFRNWYYEYFPVLLLKSFYSYTYWDKTYLNYKSHIEDSEYFIINDKVKVPLSKKLAKNQNLNENDILINYVDSYKFEKYSFYEIWDDKQYSILKEQKWDNFLKDKIVLVWATAKWIKDTFHTPFWVEYWVYIHVNFLNTILTANFLKYFTEKYEWILIFLITVLGVYINLNKWGYYLLFSNLWVFIIFLLILPIWILIFTNYILNFPFELFLSFILALLLSNIVKYLIENKDKTKLNKALSEYVSKDIAAEILSWAWAINLDWEKKRISIFFSDIEWFTTISEKFSPEELISFLKDYLNEMSNIIMDKKWLINKYEWDAIMALWWVFSKTTENISYDACSSALAQRQKLVELNKVWGWKWLPKIIVRVWINVWEAIIWNIWSKWRKMEFTAIWDNVNLASRLEWINKHYWTYLCVSESVYLDTKDFFEYRYLDKIKVKWKNNATNIYELLDYKWRLPKIELDIYTKFQEWVNLYLAKKFDEAWKIFGELSVLWDKPSRVYKDRCEDFIKAPIEDWDWIWVMKEK